MPARVVYLYVAADQGLASRFAMHARTLERGDGVAFWHPGHTQPGDDPLRTTQHEMERADVILLLLSPDFLADEQAAQWMETAERLMRRGDVRVIPILLRPVSWETSAFASLKPLPLDGTPISRWDDRDLAFVSVIAGLRQVVAFAPRPKDEPASRRPASGPSDRPPPPTIYPLRRIWSPTDLPQLTYVEPEQMVELRDHLRIPREGLVLEGPSGIGKTTALEKALLELNPSRVERMLGTDPLRTPKEALDAVLSRGFLEHGGHLIIDDFHQIDPETQRRIANLIKYLTDRGPDDAKVTLVGVNLVGETLLRDAPDLTGRHQTVSLRRQSDFKIAEMIRLGERAANIEFAQRDRFVELAGGSFFIAHMLCYQAASDEGLRETSRSFRVLDTNPDGPTLDKVIHALSRRFHDLLATFAACDDRSPPRGAALALLWLLGRSADSTVALEVARGQYRELREPLAWMAASHLSAYFNEFPRLREILYYHRDRQTLSAEDPRLSFYLRNLPWEAFLRDTRHAPSAVRWDPIDGPQFAPFAPSPEEAPPLGKLSPLPPSVILHLSDLHFQDRRQASLWFDQLAEDLRGDLAVGPGALDLVVLTGDVTDRGQAPGYRAAQQFLLDLQSEFLLAPEQIVIVPGNHDLQREAPRALEDGRFVAFSDFYRSVRPDAYPSLDEHQFTLHHFPSKRLLLLGLNSAWDLEQGHLHRASINGVALGRALRQIRNARAYDNCLKVALWHHPVYSAGDDRIRDTGFLDVLAKGGFRLGLHGHVHEAQPGLFRYDTSFAGRRVDLLGAGTFGAAGPDRPPGIPLQYQLLRLSGMTLQVHTRRREKPEGAWRPDARWEQGPGCPPLPSYEVAL